MSTMPASKSPQPDSNSVLPPFETFIDYFCFVEPILLQWRGNAPSTTPPTPEPVRKARQRRPLCHRCTWPSCSRVFAYPSTLAIHLRHHTGERPFTCNWPNCQKAFIRRDELNVHLRSHTGTKPYPCNYCPAAFSQRCNQLRHLRLHLGQFPFRCSVCSSRFNQKAQLNGHLRVKHQ